MTKLFAAIVSLLLVSPVFAQSNDPSKAGSAAQAEREPQAISQPAPEANKPMVPTLEALFTANIKPLQKVPESCPAGGKADSDKDTHKCYYDGGEIDFSLADDVGSSAETSRKSQYISSFDIALYSKCTKDLPAVFLNSPFKRIPRSKEFTTLPHSANDTVYTADLDCTQDDMHEDKISSRIRVSGQQRASGRGSNKNIRYRTKTEAWVDADSNSLRGKDFLNICEFERGKSARTVAIVHPLLNKSGKVTGVSKPQDTPYICKWEMETISKDDSSDEKEQQLEQELSSAPPSQQDLIRNKIKKLHAVALAGTTKLVGCPVGSKVESTNYSSSGRHASWTCAETATRTYTKLCPVGGMAPKVDVGLFNYGSNVGGKLHMTVSVKCAFEQCEQGFMKMGDTCRSCPAGTTYDAKESAKLASGRRDKSSEMLCRGSLEELVNKYEPAQKNEEISENND
jgi:hypothetical protein